MRYIENKKAIEDFLSKLKNLNETMNTVILEMQEYVGKNYNTLLYKNLVLIRNSIIAIIINYNEKLANKYGYKNSYEIFINSWNKFTSENVSPEIAGEKLEKVRINTLKLIKIIENILESEMDLNSEFLN